MTHCFASVLLLALVFAWCVPTAAQDLTSREVRMRAQRALQEGAYEDAIILIQQWIEWFSNSKKREILADLESWYFNLGLCYYLTGQFGDAEKAFKVYLKRYRDGPHAPEAEIYIADGYRFTGKLKQALKAYEKVLDKYKLSADWVADVLCSMARCKLAVDDWQGALPLLEKVYTYAPDEMRANWAATLLTIAYLKELKVDRVYDLVPYLIRPSSLAARSVAYNMAALEAADELFAEERYRDALWIYRLIYPRDLIRQRGERHLEDLQDVVKELREEGGKYRELLRTQETIGELEAEVKALETVENYETQLTSRVARAYMEVRRYREARALFLELRDELADEQAEEALFLAFHCSTQLKPWDRAFELGAEYMEEYPAGEYYDLVSLTMGQLYAMLKDWPHVISLLSKALEVSPEHESVGECMFLIGYASFMEEKYADAADWLRRLNKAYPGNERAEEATYWLGMSLLFDRQYQEGLDIFSIFLVDFPTSSYVEDASFRCGVCEYGLSRFRDAERKLKAFVAGYPKSLLAGEGYMMLADIAGVFGESREAVEHYQAALEYELNIELYNYCAFRCGEMLHDMNEFDALIRHFRRYIERNREGSNLPMAIYWVAKGLWQQGDEGKAMEYLLKCVEKFGRDRKALGIDMILEEWVGRSRSLPAVVAEEAWRFFAGLLKTAREEGERALALRLERTFLFKASLTDRAKEVITKGLLREENLEHASAAVLELIMDEAPARGDTELGMKAAELIVSEFTETDYALSARMALARHAISQKKFGTAEMHLNVVRQVFATSSEAAEALYMLGNLYLEQRNFAQADACFKDILGVREWRGPLWPAALYGRGQCVEQQRQYEAATAYYERIYLLYTHYQDWAAKAYLQRANCLLRLQEHGKARETLEEMLSTKELAETEAAETARDVLARLQGR